VILYTCGQKKSMGSLGHPCGKAAKALDQAGHDYELKTVSGYKMLPWTRRGNERDEIKRISGQEDVPVLALDDGSAIAGTGAIVDWAKANQATS